MSSDVILSLHFKERRIARHTLMEANMRNVILVFLLLLAAPAHSQYYQNQNTYKSGHNYDYKTGNSYNYNQTYNGATQVNGYNTKTGSNWNTTIQQNGNMNGYDSKGNNWNYNSGTKVYQNFGTGKTCVGSGNSRTCY